MSLFRPRVLAAALVFTASGAFAHTNERGIDPQNFDETVGACTDFFEHANGGWLKSNPIPAGIQPVEPRRRAARAQPRTAARNARRRREEARRARQQLRKIGDFYASAMDEKSINAAGYAPIQQRLARVDA